MVIQSLISHDTGEELLIELLGANEDTGTPLSLFKANLPQLLETICQIQHLSNHFDFKIRQNSNVKDLQTMQNDGYVIMLNYTKPDGQPHWAVLKSIDSISVTLMDPDFGPNFQ